MVQAKRAPIPDLLQLYGNLSQNNEPLMETSPRITPACKAGVQIGVQVPIFNRNQGNIAAAKADIETRRQELARLKLQLARDVASLFRDYESARETARQYKTEMLPRAEEAYRLYQTNYQNMAAAYPQALISQRTLFQLEVDYVQALGVVWQSSLGIRGFGLMDGLSMPGSPTGGGMQPTNRTSRRNSGSGAIGEHMRRTILLAIGLVILIVAGALGIPENVGGGIQRWCRSNLSRNIRRPDRAEPCDAPQTLAPARANPVAQTPEALEEAMEHWADHCAVCHGNDGAGQVPMGKQMYPHAPDMRKEATQKLTDGELFYIIENGIRLSGMRCWGGSKAR